MSEDFHVFSGLDQAGVIVSALLGAISSSSVLVLLLHIIVVIVLPLLTRSKDGSTDERVFLRMQLGVFVVCMLASDFIQAIAVLIQAKWAAQNGIVEGRVCTAQAAMIQLGDNGTAVWNSVVAVQTFLTIVVGRRMSTFVVSVTLAGGWVIIGLLSLLGPVVFQTEERGPFFGVAGLWCFIKDNYATERIFLHYFPMMIAAFTIFLCYILVFLTLRGNLEADGFHWQFHWAPASGPNPKRAVRYGKNSSQRLHLKALARKMLWYPITYIALILPIAMLRVNNVKDVQALLTGMCLLFCMGFANVFIYCSTRRIGPTPWFARPVGHTSKSVQIYVDRVTQNEVTPIPVLLNDNTSAGDLESVLSIPAPSLSKKPTIKSSVGGRIITSSTGQRGQGFVMVDSVGTFHDHSADLVAFADMNNPSTPSVRDIFLDDLEGERFLPPRRRRPQIVDFTFPDVERQDDIALLASPLSGFTPSHVASQFTPGSGRPSPFVVVN